MSRAISDQSRTIKVPAYVLEHASKVRRVSNMLSEKKGGKVLPEEVAAKTGFSITEVKWVLESNQHTLSLDTPLFNDDGTTFKELVPDKSALDVNSVVTVINLSKSIEEALSTLLNSREEEILRMRFAIGYETEYTLEEVGKRFNLTRERIRQIEECALEKLEESQIGIGLKSFFD